MNNYLELKDLLYPIFNEDGRCGIFSSKRVAEELMDKIHNTINEDNIERYVKSSNKLEIKLKNGFLYEWICPDNNQRGYRITHMYVDIGTVSLEYLNYVIFPMYVPYQNLLLYNIELNQDQVEKIWKNNIKAINGKSNKKNNADILFDKFLKLTSIYENNTIDEELEFLLNNMINKLSINL